MKEIFLNLFAFQVLSSDKAGDLLGGKSDKKRKFSVLIAAFLLVIGV